MKTVFLRALEADDKAAALLAAIREPEPVRGRQRFEVDPATFASVPRSPFAYWVSERVLGLFTALDALQAGGRIAVSGGKTLDDFRWIRATWELGPHSREGWVGYAKGGKYSRFYSDIYLLLDWRRGAGALKAYLVDYRSSRGWSPNWTAELHGSDHYLRPGLTWPRRTNGLSMRAMPRGCVFGDKGPAVFSMTDSSQELLALATVTNSRAFGLLVSLQLARTELAQSYEVGVLQNTPIPHLPPADQDALAALGRRAWSLKRSLDGSIETSHAFTLPALLQAEGNTLADRSVAWAERVCTIEAELTKIQAEIDDLCFDLYDMDVADRCAITVGFGSTSGDASDEVDVDADGSAEGEADESEGIAADATSLVTELVSWAVGVTFGRFEVRLSTGERPLPPEPEPFDPLPVCSPAMLTGDDGLLLSAAPVSYPLTLSESGLLVDDPGNARDLTAAVREVFDVVFGADADARWNAALGLLDPKDRSLRNWLATGFFEHHLKRYSRSRRKAPIYWPLATSAGSFTVWVYYHRFTRDTLFKVLNDFVKPKLEVEERRLQRARAEAGPTPTSSQRKDLAAQETFVEELIAFREDVARVAPLWNPDLNDGVLINFAPLWRLVPHHRAWQKECKDCWDKLVAGDYDWAHLAMHLWPERVVPRCAIDRSLAIAHGLEETFWTEDIAGKWKPKHVSTVEVERLIAERSSPTVKAGLDGLLAAPVPGGGGSGRRGRPRVRKANGGT